MPSTRYASTTDLCNWLGLYVGISIDWSVGCSPSIGNRNSPIPLRMTGKGIGKMHQSNVLVGKFHCKAETREWGEG